MTVTNQDFINLFERIIEVQNATEAVPEGGAMDRLSVIRNELASVLDNYGPIYVAAVQESAIVQLELPINTQTPAV